MPKLGRKRTDAECYPAPRVGPKSGGAESGPIVWLSMVSVMPMKADELRDWLSAERAAYIAERIESGDEEDDAVRIADEQMSQLFPDGQPTPRQFVYQILLDESPVGSIWIGEAFGGRPESWWVWSVDIDEEYRNRGIGRQAMHFAEEISCQHGATRLGLNVFGANAAARHLYESLGYRTVAVRMEKIL